MSSGLAQRSQKPFLLLLLCVCLNSIPFYESETASQGFYAFDHIRAQGEWKAAVEGNLLSCFDGLELSHLGCFFIMTTVYMRDKQTSLALSMVAMMVRAAQSMNLHKEAVWGDIDETERHVRRMVWWSIFMSDGYAQTFNIELILLTSIPDTPARRTASPLCCTSATSELHSPSIWTILRRDIHSCAIWRREQMDACIP